MHGTGSRTEPMQGHVRRQMHKGANDSTTLSDRLLGHICAVLVVAGTTDILKMRKVLENVTFSDLTTTVTKEQIDEALKNAQVQGKLLLELERTLTSSKEYLNKVIWSIFIPL